MKKLQSIASIALLVVLAGSLFLSACGGSSSSSVASLVVLPTVTSVSIGGRQTFSATARNSSGTTVSPGTLTWASSVASVATVDSSGVALGLAAGTTQITATVQNTSTSSSPVTLVVLPQVSSVTISPASATLKVGSQQQYTAVAKDVQGNTVSNAVFNWSVSYSGIATIDSNGLVTAVSPGAVTVSARAGSVSSPMATLNVTN